VEEIVKAIRIVRKEEFDPIGQEAFEMVAAARKAFGDLEPGTYHLVRMVEQDIVVAVPAAPVRNSVQRGQVSQKRKRGE
jgi:hypothetical protein